MTTTIKTVPVTTASNSNPVAFVQPRHAEGTGDAYPDGYFPGRWLEPAIYRPFSDDEGITCLRVYQFSDSEVAEAGEDASALPWDDDHVIEIRITVGRFA